MSVIDILRMAKLFEQHRDQEVKDASSVDSTPFPNRQYRASESFH